MVKISHADVSEIIPLRHQVLRNGLPVEKASFEGDQNLESLHLKAVDEQGMIVAVATLIQEPEAEFNLATGYRLRGMATAPEVQGQGIGGTLLKRCIQEAKVRGYPFIWCHARERAAKFYLNHGFETVKGPYELPGVGPHFLMKYQIERR